MCPIISLCFVSSEIKAGVGSLLYNSVLGYLDMVTRTTELEVGFEKVKNCAEILSRYSSSLVLCMLGSRFHGLL